MKRVLFEIAFNGKNYHGWQIQENATTIQEIIQEKLSVLIRPFNDINLVGCGRTDKGVHAEQFFFHVDFPDDIDYDNFLYKFNLSKKDQKRLKNVHEFYKEKITSKAFTKDNLNRVFYFKGKETVMDILNFRIFKSKKLDNDLIELIKFYKDMARPSMPIKADNLMVKYKISEGKVLGDKLRMIEEEWVNNNFNISDHQVENIINN